MTDALTYPFADLELARRLDRTEGTANARFVEGRASLSPGSGGTWIEVAGAYAMFDGPDSPCTQTFGLGLFQPIQASDLDTIERFFRDRGAPVNHDVCPLAGCELAAMLSGRGYRPIEHASVMYRPIQAQLGLSLPERIRVVARPIVRGSEEEAWAQTAALGWSEVGNFLDLMRDAVQAARKCEDYMPFLAELEGRPVAAGALNIVGDVALLSGASTIPEARRQGAQLALLECRLRYAVEHGCNVAMMCAEPGSASQRNAERHGFRIAYTRTKWQLK